MTFGQIFKQARKAAKKTLSEAADYVGMTIGNISDIEHSRRKPPKREILLKLEEFYGLSKNYLTEAAEKEWKMPDEAISIFTKRPQLNMALLRAADDCTEMELDKLIKEFRESKGR